MLRRLSSARSVGITPGGYCCLGALRRWPAWSRQASAARSVCSCARVRRVVLVIGCVRSPPEERVDRDRAEQWHHHVDRRAVARDAEAQGHGDRHRERDGEVREDGDAASPQHDQPRDRQHQHRVVRGQHRPALGGAASLVERVELDVLRRPEDTPHPPDPGGDDDGKAAEVVAEVVGALLASAEVDDRLLGLCACTSRSRSRHSSSRGALRSRCGRSCRRRERVRTRCRGTWVLRRS